MTRSGGTGRSGNLLTDAQSAAREADFCFRRRRFKAAIHALEQALRKCVPEARSELHLMKAVCLERLRRPEAAARSMAKGLMEAIVRFDRSRPANEVEALVRRTLRRLRDAAGRIRRPRSR